MGNNINEEMLKEYHLTGETILFRYTKNHHLEKINNVEYIISAIKDPLEMVINKPGGGHIVNAANLGQGLSFATKPEPDYAIENKICVKVELNKILEQGGQVYKVVSVPGYIDAYYLTMPEGKINVQLEQ